MAEEIDPLTSGNGIVVDGLEVSAFIKTDFETGRRTPYIELHQRYSVPFGPYSISKARRNHHLSGLILSPLRGWLGLAGFR